MSDIDYNKLSNQELESISVSFVPKKCPKCKELMVCKYLGVWGYYCEDCMFWWGTYDPFPQVKDNSKK